MNQQKQKTLRILQSKKSSDRKSSFYFLISLVSGVVLTSFSAVSYLHYIDNSTVLRANDNTPSSSAQLDDEVNTNPKVSTDESDQFKIDEIDDQPYSKISDKELRGIFVQPKIAENKQEKTPQDLTIDSSTTPFEKIQQAELAPTQSPKAVLAQKIPSTTNTKLIPNETPTSIKANNITDQSKENSDIKPKTNETKKTSKDTNSSQRIYPASAVISM